LILDLNKYYHVLLPNKNLFKLSLRIKIISSLVSRNKMILMTPVGLLNLLMGYNRISILELNLLGILVILFRELILKLIINFQLSKPILSISLSILTKNKNLILGKVFLLYLVIKKIINNIINLIINNHCLIKITKKINMLKVSVMTQIKLTTTKINILIKENFHFLAKNN
jgi:hypothetical protein